MRFNSWTCRFVEGKKYQEHFSNEAQLNNVKKSIIAGTSVIERNLKHAKAWYLVYSKANQESIANEQLLRQDYSTYLPLLRIDKRKNIKSHSIEVPLFPRYLFIQLDTIKDNWAPIRSTIGVSNIVKFGNKPAILSDGFVDEIRLRENSEGLHVIKKNYKRGDRVRIISGPMSGLEGLYMTNRGEERVLILMQLIGLDTHVTLNMESIEHEY